MAQATTARSGAALCDVPRRHAWQRLAWVEHERAEAEVTGDVGVTTKVGGAYMYSSLGARLALGTLQPRWKLALGKRIDCLLCYPPVHLLSAQTIRPAVLYGYPRVPVQCNEAPRCRDPRDQLAERKSSKPPNHLR